MATSAATVLNRDDLEIFDVIATADADTTLTYNHSLGVTPVDISITPLLQVPAGLSLWAVTTIGSGSVVLTKSVAVGSGNAGAQIRVKIARSHHAQLQ